MTDFLVKIFVKNHENIHDPAVRARYGALAGAVGILLNLLLTGGKLFAGWLTGSLSITADALNNLSDAGSSIVTLVGFRLAGQRADDKHPYGHGRMEYLAGLLVALVVLLVGVETLKSSVEKILHPEEMVFSAVSVVILLASIGIKLWMSLFNRRLGQRIRSAAMRASAADALSDAVATTAVLAGVLMGRLAGIHIDGWMGVVVAVFILRTGWSAVRETLDPLLGGKPDPDLVKAIRETVLSHPQVIGMHDLMLHDYGPGRSLMSFHAEIPVTADIMAAHDAIDHIERELREKFGIETSVHMDPIAVDDEGVIRVRRQMIELIHAIEPEMSLHDFRMTKGPLYTNLIFDVVVPYKCPLTEQQVRERIQRAARALDEHYQVVLQIDRSYVDEV